VIIIVLLLLLIMPCHHPGKRKKKKELAAVLLMLLLLFVLAHLCKREREREIDIEARWRRDEVGRSSMKRLRCCLSWCRDKRSRQDLVREIDIERRSINMMERERR
jgi:hypothetical protein